jgi:2-oxoglutarate dehydrogenase E2 component (dihydrolipoamide succinyltransferase)
MIHEIKIPSPGESVTEVEVANWFVKSGDYVEKDQELAELESDKATLPLIAEESGSIELLVEEGNTVEVGSVACKIDTSAKRKTSKKTSDKEAKRSGESKAQKREESKAEEKIKQTDTPTNKNDGKGVSTARYDQVKTTPLARKLMEENQLSVEDIINGLRKITTNEVHAVRNTHQSDQVQQPQETETKRTTQRERMSSLRRNLSKRLVAVKNETAMLTTFNEVDMTEVIQLRKKYQKAFTEKHRVKLGFMSFFVKAVTEALKAFPKVNAQLEGEEMVSPDFVDVAIAVQTDKGLMVPVLRNTETLSMADMERQIKELATRARTFKLSIEEMTGGTFTITNGGIYGSMMSTPILNPPQSGILGMHNIVERPVAVHGNVEVRPMMFIALSYDHRIVDGRDSVSFLVKIKELIESPQQMLLGGIDPDKALLGL